MKIPVKKLKRLEESSSSEEEESEKSSSESNFNDNPLSAESVARQTRRALQEQKRLEEAKDQKLIEMSVIGGDQYQHDMINEDQQLKADEKFAIKLQERIN